jgi:RNA polymerase sigma-70 factor (ECF subfamily)
MKNGKRDVGSLSDEELMLRVKGGCSASFEELVRRHRRCVLNIAYKFTADENSAEDIAQEVFCRIWEHRKTYTPTAKFSTFLYRVTTNFCISEYRSYKRRQEVHIEMRDDETTYFDLPSKEEIPYVEMEKTELAAKVKSAIASLPESQRIALILCKYENLPYSQIAEVMGTTVEAVKSLLVRAKATLREKFSRILKEK